MRSAISREAKGGQWLRLWWGLLVWLGVGFGLLGIYGMLGGLGRLFLLAGCLGWACGMLGSVVVVRRMSLVGDALAHAVLPGVVLGFAVFDERHPLVVMVGAVIAGGMGSWLIRLIQRVTRLKAEVALGIVLTVFFALGLGIQSIVREAGINSYLFGQLALLSELEVLWIGGLAWLAVGLLWLFLPVLTVVSFDRIFAGGVGLSVTWLNGLVMAMLTVLIVVALPAVGVVMVSALLIIPAATAMVWNKRMGEIYWLAGAFGGGAALVGTYLSSQRDGLASGAMIVLVAALGLVMSLIFSGRDGLLVGGIRRRRWRRNIELENWLKVCYHCCVPNGQVDSGSLDTWVDLTELIRQSGFGEGDCQIGIKRLCKAGLVEMGEGGRRLRLNREGQRAALQVVRKHRLWELYLTERANYPSDHVHGDAERVEHLMDAGFVERLDERLGFPERDPHGSLIPRGCERLAGESQHGERQQREGGR